MSNRRPSDALSLERTVLMIFPWLLIYGILSLTLFSCSSSSDEAPWFGRGRHLQPLPYKVVVGPVDVSGGIAGTLQIGMERSEVIANLGEPLIQAMTDEQSFKERVWDPEDVDNEFYEGVFAWVEYGQDKKVYQIGFDLEAFCKKFGGEQLVILRYKEHTILLGRHSSQHEVSTLLRSNLGLNRLRISASQIDVINTRVSFDFNADKHLSRIWLIR